MNLFAIVFCCRSMKKGSEAETSLSVQKKVEPEALLKALKQARNSSGKISSKEVKMLLIQGANASAQDEERDFPLSLIFELFVAKTISGTDLIEMAQALIGQGADVNMRGARQCSILQMAYRKDWEIGTNSIEVEPDYFLFMKLIIESDGLKLEVGDLYVIQAILKCPSNNLAGYGWEEIVKVLIQKHPHLIHEKDEHNQRPVYVIDTKIDKAFDPDPFLRMGRILVDSEEFEYCDHQTLFETLQYEIERAEREEKLDKKRCFYSLRAAINAKRSG